MKAIEIDGRNHFNWFLGNDYALYAKCFKYQGNLPQAREQMIETIDIMRECGADGWVERYEKKLAELT